MTMFFELNTGAKDPVVGLGTWQADAGGIRGVVIAVVKFHIMTLYISIRKLPPSSIHELLPDSVKSFSVSSNGHFTVNLQSPCYIHFDYLVHYADTITGVIKYGSTDELKGIKRRNSSWLRAIDSPTKAEEGFTPFFLSIWGIGVRLAMGELCAETWFLLIKEEET
ncbi:uncharacterized protein A4U43_C06F9960 [Asparagus officinalis]|uniref:Uncharacterized protein n=1 Tax=Asparagus officinalis TaxID=4686 RepID=A0A5P1EKU0_ASPOF|nr:uncharacterized protein LOC109845184 isoform X2 [Asparagus officinalis]ONK66592.1 uncharacterized protein A4U43_C06F9960 [Asparagus officinalis]